MDEKYEILGVEMTEGEVLELIATEDTPAWKTISKFIARHREVMRDNLEKNPYDETSTATLRGACRQARVLLGLHETMREMKKEFDRSRTP